MKRLLLIILLLAVTSLAKDKPIPERSVFVIAYTAQHRDLALTGSDLEAERHAKDEFRKLKKYSLASSIKSADIVFLIIVDSSSQDTDEVGMAIKAADYLQSQHDYDQLRTKAIWNGDAHFHRGKHAGIAAASLGYSVFFDHPSTAKDLVKQFHKSTD